VIHLVTLNPALDLELDLQDPLGGKIGTIRHSDVEAGGKALNVARFLRKQRVKSRIWLGTGGGSHPTHVLFRALLKREGLAPRFLSSQAPVRLNVVVVNRSKTQKFNHPGFEQDLAQFGQLDRAIRRGDFLVLTGRLPKGMNDSLYGSWVEAFGRKDVRVVVDTSGTPLRHALQKRPWFFKVNLFEFSAAMGRKFKNLENVRTQWSSFLKMGLLHGAVTNGPEGAFLWNGPVACRVSNARKVSNRMVVGAGDGFLAGYLKGLQSRKNFWECAKLASATATSVAHTGIMRFDPKTQSKYLRSVNLTRI